MEIILRLDMTSRNAMYNCTRGVILLEKTAFVLHMHRGLIGHTDSCAIRNELSMLCQRLHARVCVTEYPSLDCFEATQVLLTETGPSNCYAVIRNK